MKDYLEHRQYVIHELPKAEVNEKIELFVRLLGEAWLGQEVDHPVRNVWKRRDYLATDELVNLVYAIDAIYKLDPKWLKDQLKRVKSKDLNNVRGALFEIMGFSYLLSDRYQLKLAKDGNPGIDGTICFENDVRMNISMKNYGVSCFEKEFNHSMLELKNFFTNLIKKKHWMTIQCVIRFKHYPEKKDFENVKEWIKKGINVFEKRFSFFQENDLFIMEMGLIAEQNPWQKRSKNNCSYTFIGISPYHKNEYKNLLDKLEDACANLISQKKEETEKELNGLYIHLHENLSVAKCQKVMQQYLDEHPELPISFVLLYDTSITRNETKYNASVITHCFLPAISATRYPKWINKNQVHVPNFTFLIGQVSLEEAKIKIFRNGDEALVLDDVYLYQYGEEYILANQNEDGSITGELISIAPGIRRNIVAKLGNREVVLSEKFPVEERLEIM